MRRHRGLPRRPCPCTQHRGWVVGPCCAKKILLSEPVSITLPAFQFLHPQIEKFLIEVNQGRAGGGQQEEPSPASAPSHTPQQNGHAHHRMPQTNGRTPSTPASTSTSTYKPSMGPRAHYPAPPPEDPVSAAGPYWLTFCLSTCKDVCSFARHLTEA